MIEPATAQEEELIKALKLSLGAFRYQVNLCHDRQRQFDDHKQWSRPPDPFGVMAHMYAATAEPIAKIEAILSRYEPDLDPNDNWAFFW